MSQNAEFEAEFSNHGSGPFSDAQPGGDPFQAFSGAGASSFPGQGARTHTTASKPKPNLVVRAWRVVKDFFVGVGRAVFSKQFWIDFIGTAIRDALAALGYSIGMRMVKKAAATGDIIFRDRHGVVASNGDGTRPQDTAFSSDPGWPPKAKPAYGSVQENFTAYPANKPFSQPSFVN